MGRSVDHRCGGAGSRSLRQRHPTRSRPVLSAEPRPRSPRSRFQHGRRAPRPEPRSARPGNLRVPEHPVHGLGPAHAGAVAEGSGKGVFASNLCANVAALRDRAPFLLERYAEPVLVETYLPGPEFTVAILGNGPEAYCLPVIGFDFSTLPEGAPPVYGYEAKWVWDRPEAPLAIFQCPARVPAGLYREIERTALDAYHALGCRDWCRVDLRVDRFGVPNVLELNPLPGIIPDPAMNSCFPKAARAAGFGYDELIQEVARIAWRRQTGRDLLADARAHVAVGARHAVPAQAIPA